MTIEQHFTQNATNNGNDVLTLNIDPTAPITSLSKGMQQFTCQYAFKIDPLCALNFDPPYVRFY